MLTCLHATESANGQEDEREPGNFGDPPPEVERLVLGAWGLGCSCCDSCDMFCGQMSIVALLDRVMLTRSVTLTA